MGRNGKTTKLANKKDGKLRLASCQPNKKSKENAKTQAAQPVDLWLRKQAGDVGAVLPCGCLRKEGESLDAWRVGWRVSTLRTLN